MKISIKSIRSASFDEWDNIWKECDYSTFFHSREWAEIWNVYTKGKMRLDPKLIIFSDGKKALFPLSYQKGLRGLVKKYISSPAGTFGGWISTDNLDVAHAALVNKFLMRRLGNLVWRINPYDELLFKIGLQTSVNDETQVLNLKNDFDVIYKKWTKGHRSAVHKAQHAGVFVKLASTSEEWKSYYQVYEDSIRRWGEKASSKYEWSFFYEMFQRSSPNIKLWLAIYENKIIAGAIIFYAKKHVVYWHGAALQKYFNLRPVNLIIYEALRHSCTEAYVWFDFNPSGGHKGVESFKKSFGAKPLPCPVVKLDSVWIKAVRNTLSIITKGRS